jgi:predicted RNA methylase
MSADSRAKELDQFFTRPDVAQWCLALLVEQIGPLNHFAAVIEPSVGGGAFYDQLPERTRVGVDIDPKRTNFVRADFLSLEPPLEYDYSVSLVAEDGTEQIELPRDPSKVLVVGNPPFGSNGRLALRFLNHALKFADTVAFVMPKVFKGKSFLREIDPNAHLLFQQELPRNSFEVDGATKDVPTMFQIWERKEEQRPLIEEAAPHPDFEFLSDKKLESAMEKGVIIMRRAGKKAGTVLDVAVIGPSQKKGNFVGELTKGPGAGSRTDYAMCNLFFIRARDPALMRQRLIDLELHKDPSVSDKTHQLSINQNTVRMRYRERYGD